MHVFKFIILKCIVGAEDGLCGCRSTEGSVEQRCTAVITPCQVKFAASCAGLSPQVITRRVACLGYRTHPSLTNKGIWGLDGLLLRVIYVFIFLLQVKILSASGSPGAAFRDI